MARPPFPSQVADGAPPATERARQRWGKCQTSDTPAGRGGSSNSLPEDSFCPKQGYRPKIGVDTISWGWRDSEAVDRFLRLDGTVPPGDDPRPLRVVPMAGGAMRLNRRLDGLGTVGAFPSASLLYIEGRARALERCDETDHGLGSAATLPHVAEQVTEGLGALLGAALRAPGGLRRADLAGELSWARAEDGREFLKLLGGLHSPRHKVAAVWEIGGEGLETVQWKTPGRFVTVLRAYDKGVESGTAPVGERIRLERQLRYKSDKRPSVGQWLAGDLADLYTAPIRKWLKDGVVAGTPQQLLELLTDAIALWPTYWASGTSWATGSGADRRGLPPDARNVIGEGGAYLNVLFQPRYIERLAGTLMLANAYGASWRGWNAKQRQRRMLEIRKHGLLLTDRPVTIDVDQAVTSLCDMWRAAA